MKYLPVLGVAVPEFATDSVPTLVSCRATILISRTISEIQHISEVSCGSDAIPYKLARQVFSGQYVDTFGLAKSGAKNLVADFGGTEVLATLLDPTRIV